MWDLPKKGGLGQFADLRGGDDKQEGSGVFHGGWIPQCTLWIFFKVGVLTNFPIFTG